MRRNLFVADPLDFSPDRRQQTAISWATLVFGILMAGGTAVPLHHVIESFIQGRKAVAVASAQVDEARRQRELLVKAAQKLDQSPRARARRDIRQLLELDYTEHLRAIEQGVKDTEGKVSIDSVHFQRTAAQTEMTISAAASTSEDMVRFVRVLSDNAAIGDAGVQTQRSDQRGGTPVERFTAYALNRSGNGAIGSGVTRALR